jgi:hypothetical protein
LKALNRKTRKHGRYELPFALGEGPRLLPHYNANMPHHAVCIFTFFLGGCILIAQPVVAQQPNSPGETGQRSEASVHAPSAQAHPIAKSQPTPPHAFWDRTNILLFSGVGVFRGLDYASTRNFQARGREEVLIPDDIVNNSAGFASLEAAGTAASVGLSYWMHRVGHHRIERWISIAHIGVTGFGVARNYSLKSKHPVP